jgi:polyisoprenoid-binding protein YceI
MTTTTTATLSTTFAIDKTHSDAAFQVRHLITRVRGRFDDFEGTIHFDPAHPEQSSVSFSILASSIDTSEPQRDGHLRSADFFDVEQFPRINFASRRVVPTGAHAFDVIGDLTIHGVTKEITLPVAELGVVGDPWGKQRAGFEAELTLNRKDFGLNWNAALETGGFLVGDEVKVALSVQAVAQ